VKLALALLLFSFFVDVAIPGKVYTDYDSSVNFLSQYRTFMWIKPPHTGDPLMNERIVNAINAALTAKGWRLVDRDADVGAAAHVTTREQHTFETFYSGFWWRLVLASWGIGTRMATTTEKTYTTDTLVADLFDGRTKNSSGEGRPRISFARTLRKPRISSARVSKSSLKSFLRNDSSASLLMPMAPVAA
jgi:hypothetical protein